MAGVWLAAMLLLPGGGLLWQWGVVQQLGGWVMHSVLAHLDLAGLFT